MSGVNKVIILGRAGQDPEIRYSANGGAIANLSVATSEKWKDKNTGEQKEDTEWHRVVVFGKLAEIIGEYVRKGSQVYFEGKNKTRKWTDQQGVERYTTEIVADTMQMLGGAQGQQSNQQQGGYSQPQQQGGYGQQQQSRPQQQQQQQGYGNQHQAPRQNQGYSNQQGFNQHWQATTPHSYLPQQGGAINPMEPPIDLDDDILF